MPGGRGDADRVRVMVNFTPDEAKELDATRGQASRAEYVRGFVPLSVVPVEKGTAGDALKIYALVDPRDGCVRYVGRTKKRLSARLAGHLRMATNEPMRVWLDDLRGVRLKPAIVLIVEGASEQDEARWIAWFKARGELLNGDPGRPGVGRGYDRTVVGVSLAPDELARLDAARGDTPRAEYLRRHGLPPAA